MPHHNECWQQNSGCTTFACKGKAPASQSAVDKDYDFEDLVEEYSLNKIVISLEDLFDDKVTEVDKDIYQSGGVSEDSRSDSTSFDWLGTLFWIIVIIGLIIWLLSETL